MLMILISLGVVTFLRNHIYHTKLTLWTDVAKKSPANARAHNALGLSYWIHGRHKEAILEFNTSIELNGNCFEAYWNLFSLGEAFEEQGNFYHAGYCYDIICKKAPPLLRKYQGLACDRANRLYLGMKK